MMTSRGPVLQTKQKLTKLSSSNIMMDLKIQVSTYLSRSNGYRIYVDIMTGE